MNRSTKLIIAGATAGVAIVSGAFIVRHDEYGAGFKTKDEVVDYIIERVERERNR